MYSGSELITLDLATLLKSMNFEVVVASFYTAPPLVDWFKTNEITVFSLVENPQALINQKFDLIWSHHWPLLGFCIHELGVQTKYLVLASLSPYEPLEALNVATDQAHCILFNSEENLNSQKSELTYHPRSLLTVFPNSLTSNWLLNDTSSSPKEKKLKSIGIVSNHIPLEVVSAGSIFEEHGIEIRAVGIEVGQAYVTPEWIDSLDAVITIGHTVQKAMSRGVPVYCYDRFGGPGWLNTENLSEAAAFNYSGRCCSRKLTAFELFQDILQGYEQAYRDCRTLQEFTCTHYNLEQNVLKVLTYLDTCDWKFDPLKLSHRERKVCQLILRHEFNLDIPATVNVLPLQPSCIAIQIESLITSPWNNLLTAYFIDGLPERMYTFCIDELFQFGGIALSKSSDNRVVEVFSIDEEGHKVQAILGLYSSGIGQQHPNVPFSYSSRFLFKFFNLSKTKEIYVGVRFSKGQEIILSRIVFLKA